MFFRDNLTATDRLLTSMSIAADPSPEMILNLILLFSLNLLQEIIVWTYFLGR